MLHDGQRSMESFESSIYISFCKFISKSNVTEIGINFIFPNADKLLFREMQKNIFGSYLLLLKNYCSTINGSERKLRWRFCRNKRDGGGATRSRRKVCFYKLFPFSCHFLTYFFLSFFLYLFAFRLTFFLLPVGDKFISIWLQIYPD